MDEPLSNLDAKLRAQMRTELQRLQEELGVTTMYVTHDQTEAMTMGNRIAILDGGELQQVSSPLECYHSPANLFVADFIGEPGMNFFDVERREDRLVGDAFAYPISDRTLESLGDETDLVFGIRPEDIELVDGPAGDHDFEAVVDVVEPMGDENTVYLRFEEADDSIVASVGGLTSVETDERVTIRIPEEAIHLFDHATGDALHNRRLDTDERVDTSPV